MSANPFHHRSVDRTLCFALSMMGAVLLGAPLAKADVSGPACVTDGGHLTINGHRSYGLCSGGTPTVLVNIDAPTIKQTCQDPKGKPWDCGRWAAYVLLELTKKQTVTCQGNATDMNGDLVAVCYANGLELNRTMVDLGWALPIVGDGGPYAAEVEHARDKKLGLWQGRFERPSLWRAQHDKDE
ncbi:thermonuclease family protein [Rhodospirillum sp. A1_3_36]|uniref:thermonuclease family protein n=1 Tax=Rhodospirillum sp. A1_3_36 TaxID=3391666 RepID=UPI0039A56A3B